MNALPTPPEHARPAAQLFGWGAGNFGQLGMGEDLLGEYEKPMRNKIVEQKMQDGEFGEDDAGLEAVAAGGLFTLLLDEKGTVSLMFDFSIYVLMNTRYGPSVPTTTPLSDDSQQMSPTPKMRANSSTSTRSPHSHIQLNLSSKKASGLSVSRQAIA